MGDLINSSGATADNSSESTGLPMLGKLPERGNGIMQEIKDGSNNATVDSLKRDNDNCNYNCNYIYMYITE